MKILLSKSSVVGMAGVGKTTLAKKVYEDFTVRNHFSINIWITVMQSFKLEELLKVLIHQVISVYNQNQESALEGIETMGRRGLQEILNMMLRESKYLLVIYDVWNLDAWNAIKTVLPLSNCGSRVLLATRNRRLANMCSSEFEGRVYSLEPLSVNISWQLFCNRTFRDRECPTYLEDVARKILDKCGGLPLAIVAIADVLSTMIQGCIDEWEMILRNFGHVLLGNQLQSVTKAFLRSYHDLPFCLKACLLYASAIPAFENHCSEMLRLWIAEGFVLEEEGKMKEQVAYSYFYELVDRSLIQVSSSDLDKDGTVLKYHIHGLLREVINCKSRVQGFASVVSDNRYAKWPRKARRLCVDNITWRSREYLNLKCISGLRTIAISRTSIHPTKFFPSGKFRQVRTLYLKSCFLKSFPDEITKLYDLRYLNLNLTGIHVVPSSIEKLQNLEMLDLGNTNVTTLPPSIKNLQRLHYLAASQYIRGDTNELALPTRRGFDAILALGSLQSLQELWYIELNRESSDTNIIEDLGRLHQLKKLGITNLKPEDNSAICSLIQKFSSLRRLELYFQVANEEETVDMEDISTPPHFLQWLTLQGRMDKVPNWITSLSNLAVLELQGSRLRKNVLEAIQALPSLVHLELHTAFDGNELLFENRMFQKLKGLCIVNLQALRKVVVEKGSMPCLEKLHIKYCPILENVPSGIENLAELKDLEFAGVSENLISRIDRTKVGEDSWRIEHIMEVRAFLYKQRKLIEYQLQR